MQTYERMSLEEFFKSVNVTTWRKMRTRGNEILIPIGEPQRSYGNSVLKLDQAHQHMLIAGRTGSGYYNFINNILLLMAFTRNIDDPLNIWVIDADNGGFAHSMMLCNKYDADELRCGIPYIRRLESITSDVGRCAVVEDIVELVSSDSNVPTIIFINEADKLLISEAVSSAFHNAMQQALGTNIHFILGTERLYFTKMMYALSATRICTRTSHCNSMEMLNDAEAATLPTVGYCVCNEHFGHMESENSLWKIPYLDATATDVLRKAVQGEFSDPQYAVPVTR